MGLWFALACPILAIAFLAALPTLLAKLLDPAAIRRIEAECEMLGLTDVRIKPYPNHYGVRYRRYGKAGYARAEIVGKKVVWKGKNPPNIPEVPFEIR